MKSVQLVQVGGFLAGTHLQTVQEDVPVPTNNEVLVQVEASAINPVDWKMAEYGFLLPSKEPVPVALGCDIAGTVLACPSDESLVGKRIISYLGASKMLHALDKGAFTEKVLVEKDLIAEIPSDMTFAQGASLPVGALTAKLLVTEHTAAKDWLLVWGASSSVGFNVVQIAKKEGYKVIAVASSNHEKTMEELGADGFVDYRSDDVEAKVEALVSGQEGKLNGAVDCIGAPSTFGTAAKLVKKLGNHDDALVVSTTIAMGLTDVEGVARRPVDLGTANDEPQSRQNVSTWLKEIVDLKPMPIHSVPGPFSAETVEKAFQINKEGVSGKKVVIEWSSSSGQP
eukprot:CAMPEP_0168811892 /NCGR_PEP_ID=MMETSP0726-20121227/4359_1 /TAXON_ID=265536 /ORGANISM="Amphiprora sp., Strain CCMP467" /LENGTH=340 /DNA_ID=CAMNT_0008863969 /DNA_START=65 /DNA_END=1087 /DNA_ORIENTATION=+